MMANEFRTLDSHSAEYFGETRDYWWNLDFLELMGRRLSLDRVHDVLDVGCGIGHWGQLLANVLPRAARVQGVDRDPLWVEKASSRAAALNLADRFSYQVSVAETLPFADASFDLVTCQTVLSTCPIQPLWSAKWSVLRARVGSFWQPSPTILRIPSSWTRSVSTLRSTRSSLASVFSSLVSAARQRWARVTIRLEASFLASLLHAASSMSVSI